MKKENVKRAIRTNNSSQLRLLIWVLVVIGVAIVGIISYLVVQHINKPKIAFVKSTLLISQYKGFIEASNTYNQTQSVWLSNLDTLRNELETAVNEFEENRAQLTSAEINASREVIEKKQSHLQKYQQAIQQKAQEEDQVLLQKVLNDINIFLKEYGERNNYAIIMGATEVGNIVFGDSSLDITDQVLKELNERYGKHE